MSVKDLIANWEEALAVALSQPDDQDPVTEMLDDALTDVADRRIAKIRSNVHAGVDPTFTNRIICFTITIGCKKE